MITMNRKFPDITVKTAETDSGAKRACMTKKYDIWNLGKHRLFCGDSTDIETYEWLMGALKADLIVTDVMYKPGNETANKCLYETLCTIEGYLKDEAATYVFHSNTGWEFCRMKPELLVYLILISHPAGIVLDPFGGIGFTLAACEQTGHTCRMVEREERFCDAIVQRFIEQTGSSENIERIRDGVTRKYAELEVKYENTDTGQPF